MMPPFLIATLGVAGAVAAARLLMRESRRVTRIIDPHRAPPTKPEDRGEQLVKDPVTGAYRPRANP